MGQSLFCGDGEDEIKKGSKIVVDEGSTIYLLLGKFPYRIKFHSNMLKKKITTPTKALGTSNAPTKELPDKEQRCITTFFDKNKTSNKRPIDREISHESERKKARISKLSSSSDDEAEDEHMQQVKKRLAMMKEDLKNVKADVIDISPGPSSNMPESVSGRKGDPAANTQWFQRDTLLSAVFKGVESREKVMNT